MAADNDVFISYAKGDRSYAQEFADWLLSYGFKVWWDRELLAGQDYPQELERIIQNSRCAVVLWSENSVKSRWVYQEAELAAKSGKLVPALVDIDAAKIPMGMRTTHATSFSDRDGLLKAIQAAVQSPLAEQRTKSPFKQMSSYLFRRGVRLVTALRVTAIAAVAAVAWFVYGDVSDWRAISRSLNRPDFEAYLASGSLRFHRKSALERMEEIDAFNTAVRDNDFRSYKNVFEGHSATLYSKIASIAYARYESKTGAALIFQDTNKRLLSESDIANLDCDKLRLARNQIFFRRGYCFTSDLGISVLPNADCPKACNEILAINDAAGKSLNDVETKNVTFIERAEKNRASDNQCPAPQKPRCSRNK
ncbi:MAG: TIR domain-containing protein [Rhodomicrobium sp.]